MLFLLSGASGSGKKTVAPLVARRVGRLAVHHENEIPATTQHERMANMERWVERALALQAEGTDLLLPAQSPLGELLASPRAPELEGIAACVLDCHDHERTRRLARREPDPRWPYGMDTLCWAAWHRMHAVDPQWEQRVIRAPAVAHYQWDRWAGWRAGDARWQVELVDTTARPVAESVDAVSVWVERARAGGTPLSRDAAWWQ
jgi:hypothetical protein